MFDCLWNTSIFQGILYLSAVILVFLIIRYFIEQLQLPDLRNKAVLITGCDTGFGRGLALKCLENNMPVFAGCLTNEGIKSLTQASHQYSGILDAFLMDVTSDESVQKITKQLETKLTKYNGLHAVVNNAGITGKHINDDFLTIDEYKKVADINLWGAIRTTQYMKKLLKMAKGRVITVASICARVGLPGLGPYSVTKYGISAYCDVIRQELRPFGVSVHILEPGFFDTPLINRQKIDKEVQEAWSDAPIEVKEEYGEQFFIETRKSIQQFLDSIASDKISLVIDAYYHAITSKYPRSRYQIGLDSILFFIPFSYLPTGLQDYFFAFIGLFLPKPASI